MIYLALPSKTDEHRRDLIWLEAKLRSRGLEYVSTRDLASTVSASDPDREWKLFKVNIEALVRSDLLLFDNDTDDPHVIWAAGVFYGVNIGLETRLHKSLQVPMVSFTRAPRLVVQSDRIVHLHLYNARSLLRFLDEAARLREGDFIPWMKVIENCSSMDMEQ